MDKILSPPTGSVYCLANTGRLADPARNVLESDGTISNDSIRRACYRPITAVAPTCCAGNPHRWCRADHSTIRRFTAREQATLQSFPASYMLSKLTHVSITGVGNAFPPLGAAALMA